MNENSPDAPRPITAKTLDFVFVATACERDTVAALLLQKTTFTRPMSVYTFQKDDLFPMGA